MGKIVETTLWLGKQGLPLRGQNEGTDSQNRGNFLELLSLRSVDSPALNNYFDKEKFTYTSANVQNELIEIIREIIQSKIVRNVIESKAFSIVLDGTLCISVHEQLSFCVRYVDIKFKVRESFLAFGIHQSLIRHPC